jgi:hypothetical protein
MAFRSRYGFVDATNPRAAGVCDRGGEIRKLSELRPQMRWAGDRLVATGWLVCRDHMDVPNAQDRVRRPRADPVPVSDPRPMPATVYVPSFGSRLSINFVLGSSALGTSPSGDALLDDTFILDESLLA